MSKRETLLEMVRCIREGIKTSPGLSHAPFSDEGWAIIEEALSPEERGMFVPLEVWNWLMGEGPDFEPTEKQKGALMGPGRYWWRSELCRRMEDAGSCPLSPRGTLVGCQHNWIYVANVTGQPYWQCDKCLEATNTDPLPSLLPQSHRSSTKEQS